METYQKTIIVKENDLDELNHVNNVRYLQWIQDISKEHWMTTASEEMRKDVIWVVMNHNINYKNAAKLGDVLNVKTHIMKSHGATSIRLVEMRDKKNDRLFVQSSTKWCLLNAHTLKPIRISAKIKSVFS